MTPDEMRASILDQLAAWQAGDPDRLAQGFNPDGEIVVAGRRIIGHAALRARVTRFAGRHKDISVTLRRMVFGDNCAALEYRWEDTKTDTGERYIADDAVWVDFASGRIARWREYWDAVTPKPP